MFLEVLKKLKEHNFFSAAAMSTSVDLQKLLTILQNSGMLLAKYYMHVYVNPDLFYLAGATSSDPRRRRAQDSQKCCIAPFWK